MITSRSVVQCVPLQATVSAPGSGNWDCHVFHIPFSPGLVYASGLTPPNLVPYLLSPNGAFTSTGVTATTQMFSGSNVLTMPTGTDWWTDTTNSVVSTASLQLPFRYTNGPWRLVGLGIEVVNTTPELYINGAVTAYKSPSPMSRIGNITSGSGTTLYAGTCYTNVTPPSTLAQATLYPNSRTWSAKEGSYQVFSMNTTDVPVLFPTPTQMVLTRGFQLGQAQATPVPILFSRFPGDCCQPLPYDTSGVIFTNLTPQTTLQVTVKYFVERFPVYNDGDLLVLGTPSPQYDPVAMEIYTRALSDMPVGVPFSENPLGEWFDDLLKTIGNWAAPIGAALSGLFPPAAAIGSIVGGAASGVRTLINAPSGNQNPPPPSQQKKKKRKRAKKPAAPKRPQKARQRALPAPPARRRPYTVDEPAD